MKLITELTGTAIEGTAFVSTGTLHQVLEEPVKGFFRSTKLSAEGVLLKRGEHQLFVPLAALWKMGETVEPQFIPAAPAQPAPSAPAPTIEPPAE